MNVVERIKNDIGLDLSPYKGLVQIMEFWQSHRLGDESTIIENAIRFAFKCHEHQKRDSGEQYIHHVLRVAERCVWRVDITTHDGLNVVLIALLHDTVEDGHTTHEIIKAKYGEKVSESVKDLSRLKSENYCQFIFRIKNSGRKASILVKIEDLSDNTDPEKGGSRNDKYRFATHFLQEGLICLNQHQTQDREHIVELNYKEKEKLVKWLEQPNGSHHDADWRVTFEAVEGGGILVRTQPYRYIPPSQSRSNNHR